MKTKSKSRKAPKHAAHAARRIQTTGRWAAAERSHRAPASGTDERATPRPLRTLETD